MISSNAFDSGKMLVLNSDEQRQPKKTETGRKLRAGKEFKAESSKQKAKCCAF